MPLYRYLLFPRVNESPPSSLETTWRTFIDSWKQTLDYLRKATTSQGLDRFALKTAISNRGLAKIGQSYDCLNA